MNATLGAYKEAGSFDRFAWEFDTAAFAANRESIDPVDVALVKALRKRNLAGFFRAAVRAKKNIAIVGDTGSGKTTFMKALCRAVPKSDGVYTVQGGAWAAGRSLLHRYPKASRLNLRFEPVDFARGVAVLGRIRSEQATRLLVDDLQGGAAFELLKLLCVRYEGSIVSFHARGCAGSAYSFWMMASQHDGNRFHGRDYSQAEIFPMFGHVFDVVVHVAADWLDDQRRVYYVKEIQFNPLARVGGTV